MRILIFSPVLLSLFVLFSCSSDQKSLKEVQEKYANTTAEDGLLTDGSELKAKTAEPYGTFLTDATGKTIYLFTADKKGKKSACYEDCAEAWPPVTVKEEVEAGEQVDQSKIGTITRKNGKEQVTYNGWPLYYYIKDKAEGDVKGQDIHSFDGGWYLISPQGHKLEKETALAE